MGTIKRLGAKFRKNEDEEMVMRSQKQQSVRFKITKRTTEDASQLQEQAWNKAIKKGRRIRRWQY